MSIDGAVLLHEMLHLKLFITGKNPSHDSPDWRAETERMEQTASKEKWPIGTLSADDLTPAIQNSGELWKSNQTN
jgi:hypothetical protein